MRPGFETVWSETEAFINRVSLGPVTEFSGGQVQIQIHPKSCPKGEYDQVHRPLHLLNERALSF